MQKNEVIIQRFIKTLKEESPMDVKGDPAVLSRVFEALEKKKRRKKMIQLFLGIGFVITCMVYFISSFLNTGNEKSTGMVVSSEHSVLHYPENRVNTTTETPDVLPTKKMSNKLPKKQDADFTNVVSYKFNNHQVDVFKNGEEEFIQINVFGADGVEQDVLKIMEDLKKSYKKNEVYVDSVKHK